MRVKADHGRDFHPLADHKKKLRKLIKGEICVFSAFPFSLQLMFDQTFCHETAQSCTSEFACCGGY